MELDEEGLELGPGTPSSPGMAVTVSASGCFVRRPADQWLGWRLVERSVIVSVI